MITWEIPVFTATLWPDPNRDPEWDRSRQQTTEPTERAANNFDQIGPERSQKQPTAASAAAHNPEVAGSSPVSATIKTTDFERNWWFFLNFLLLFKKVKFEIVRYQVFSKHGVHECSNSYTVFVKRFLHNKSRKGGLLDRPSFQKKKTIRNVLQRKHKTCVLTLREHCVQFGNNIRNTPQQV